MKGQHPGIVHSSFANFGKHGQQVLCLLNLVEEIICRSKGAFADIPINSGVDITFCFAAKTWRTQFWRH